MRAACASYERVSSGTQSAAAEPEKTIWRQPAGERKAESTWKACAKAREGERRRGEAREGEGGRAEGREHVEGLHP